MSCLTPEMIAGLSAGTLSPQERTEAEEHLTQCESCRAALAAAREPSEPDVPNPGIRARVARVAGPILIAGLCSAFFCFTVSLAAMKTLLTKAAGVYDSYPSLDKPPLLQLSLPSEEAMAAVYIVALMAFFGMGLLTALVVRPRDPWDAMSIGLEAALAATLATLPVMTWATTLSLTVVPALPDLKMFDTVVKSGTYSGKQDVTTELVERYPDLAKQPDFERGNLFFQKIVADSVVGSGSGALLGILLSLASSGVLALCGTLAGGYLLHRGDRFYRIVFPYLELTIPSSALICAVVLLPFVPVSNLTGFWPNLLPFLPLGLLVPFTLMAVHRRWDVTLRIAVYVTYFFYYRDSGSLNLLFLTSAGLTLLILVRMWRAHRREMQGQPAATDGEPASPPPSKRGLYIGVGLGVAVLIALSASYIASQLIAQSKETVIVLAARSDLAAGTSIDQPEEYFEQREILRRETPANAIFREQADHAKGRKLRVALAKDRPLTEDVLEPRRDKASWTGLDQDRLKAGQRGYAIAVQSDDFFEKQATSGTRVDISLQETNSSKDPVRLLHNVELLAVDASKDSRPALVVVSVTPQQALLLAWEEERGSLLVRAKSDAEVAPVSVPPTDPLAGEAPPQEAVADPLLPEKIKEDVQKRVRAGKQTYTLKIDADHAGGGYAISGSDVDILHSWRNADGPPRARLLAQKVRVQAVDLAAFRPEAVTEVKRVLPHQITLEVSPQEAAHLAQAQKRGTLRFVLRPTFENGDAPKNP